MSEYYHLDKIPTRWDCRFINLAHVIAEWSEDPSTQVGAIIVNQHNQIITTGYNGLPRGINQKPERMSRPTKYDWMEHAERNAIYQAASLGISIRESTMYCTLCPCTDCARAIIQSGITKVVTHPYKDTSRFSNWDNWELSAEMLKEAGIDVMLLKE